MIANTNGDPRVEQRVSRARARQLLVLAGASLVALPCASEPRQTPGVARATVDNARAPAPSPFVEGVRIGFRARLNVAGRRAFLTTDTLLLGLHDNGVRIEPALLEGLQQRLPGNPRVFGDMPASGWVVRTRYAERASWNALSRWSGSEWVNADRLLPIGDRSVIAASRWSDGRLLMLVGDEFEGRPSFVQVGGSPWALPQLPRAVNDEFLCLHALQPGALSALPSGEVYLASRDCPFKTDAGATTHGVLMSSWSPGQTRAKVTPLPELFGAEFASGQIWSVLAVSNTDVFAAGTRTPHSEDSEQPPSAYLAHFDGKSWRVFSAPPIGQIEELQRAPDGRLWALGDGQIWSTRVRVSQDAEWQRAVLPEFAKEVGDSSASSFWVQDNEQVWATLDFGDYVYLVHTKRGSTALSAPSDQELAQLSNAMNSEASCDRPTLVFFALGRNAPTNADMPRVRAALRGYTDLEGHAQFIEVPFLTRSYLGARGDWRTLFAIQRILSDAHIPGVVPEILCLSGAPTRTLKVDFSPKPGQSAKTSGRSPPNSRLRDFRSPWF